MYNMILFNPMTLVYQLITLFILVIVIWNMIETEDKMDKAMSAIIIIPLALRVLLIK